MAKTLVGALRVTLGLDSAEFASGAEKATGISQRLGKQLMGLGAAVSTVGAAVKFGVRRQLNAADEMSKTAAKIGVPIEELSKLAYAADLSGISMGTLQTGLQRLSKNLAESEDKFAKLGVQVRDATGKIAKMPDGAEKTALAMELFGRSGAEMIPLLNGGAEGVKALTDEAEAMGLVFTEETGRAAEQFNDNLSRLQYTITGLWRQLAAQLAPVMARLSEYLVDMARWFQNLSPEMQKFIGVTAGLAVVLGPVLIGLGLAVSALGALFSPLLLVVAAVGAVVAAFVYWDEITEALRGGIGNLVDGGLRWLLKNLGYTQEEIDYAMLTFWRGMEPLTALKDMFVSVAAGAVQLAVDLRQAAQDAYTWVTTKFEELVAWLEGLPARMVEIGANIIQGLADGIASKWEAVKASIRTADQSMMQTFQEDWMIQSPSKVTEEYGRYIAEGLANGIAAGKDVVGQAVTSLNDTAKGAMKGIGDLGKQVGDMFATAATNVLTGVQSLREAVMQLLQQISQLLINNAMKQIFGNIFAGFNLGLPGYASGTFSAARGLAIVGEEGPELVNFRGGERVYDASDTARLARSGEGQAGQPVSVTSNVYLDGEVILSRLETAEGEAKVSSVLRRLGYAG